MPDMKRLFAAIHIKPTADFRDIYENLRQILGFHIIKWVDINNIHITLKFFGETPVEEIPAITDALKASVKEIKDFEIKLSRTGIFGSYYNPRVIWVGIEENEMLNKLSGNVVSNLEASGYLSDRQNFVPHLTLGRIKEIKDKNHFQEVIAHFSNYTYQTQQITGFTLYESILRKEGPEYVVIEEFTFD
ncbi:MAG: RNA 2',3'-cyclic phosphodiesterase [Lentimicrobium sp.]|jgi:2'-5' RNA ligase|nr:RNA 2',3'-cyclic phosphodiesterase [Lentimicrobium sp.]